MTIRKLLDSLPAIGVSTVLLGALILFVGKTIDFGSQESGTSLPAIAMPTSLTPAATRGRFAFEENCAACHGRDGAGSNSGPPLIHDIYNPGHHSDEAFYRAASRGVPSHHWNFGDMPPQPGISFETVSDIVAFIREVQRANGIVYREHRM